PYFDRSESYGGPIVDSISGGEIAPDILFSPSVRSPWLAVFRIIGLTEGGRPVELEGSPVQILGRPERGAQPLLIDLGFRTEGGNLRLPVPTGSVIDPESVRLEGRVVGLWKTAAGEPFIRVPGPRAGRVTYQAFEVDDPPVVHGSWPAVPEEFGLDLHRFQDLDPQERVSRAVEMVKGRLKTRRSSEVAEIILQGRARGLSFLQSVYEAGGGDCDVLNSMLASILHRVGLETRLAVGWLGVDGQVSPGLHAWVEVDLGGGRWTVADASAPIGRIPALVQRDADRVVRTEIEGQETNRGDEPETDESRFNVNRRWTGAAIFFSLGCLGTLAWWWRRKGARVYSPGRGEDAPLLLGSFLRDRERWVRYPAVWRRPLVESVGGKRRSLAALERAASAGMLFSSATSGRLVERTAGQAPRMNGDAEFSLLIRRANSRCGIVVNTSNPMGREAAQALSAADLDEWSEILKKTVVSGFSVEVEQAMRDGGCRIKIFEADDLPRPIMVLSLAGRDHVVVVSRANQVWRCAGGHFSSQRRQAVFWGVEIVVDNIPSINRPARKVLSDLARGIIAGQVGGAQ
ncbi:MAG: transglutaminase-like domain-containing protein, partial [Thermoanaerobaculales bacterium]|nr:transglutaminase-like domain-containing protein [Thermoanaerobaculales bacterium]